MPELIFDRRLTLMPHQTNECQSLRYARLSFTLAKPCGQIIIRLTLSGEREAQIPLCLFDPEGSVRVMKASNAVKNDTLSYLIAENEAGSGCIPGALPLGEWKLLLYKRRMYGIVDARVTVSIAGEAARLGGNPLETAFDSRCLSKESAWYKGELHTHSDESTGYCPIEALVSAATECGLDFLAVTDHFTASHWLKLDALGGKQRPLLFKSMEVSGDRGHANLHGLTSWVNPLVDDNEQLSAFLGLKTRPDMNNVADEAHAQGALFCLNHVLSGPLGWSYRDFDLRKADLFEIYCAAEQDVTLCYPQYYDMLLARGLRLTAIASSDSHHPTKEGPWKIGRALTYIYAENLSQRALLRALRLGHAFVGINGCQIRLEARCAEQSAMMGDTLPLTANAVVSCSVTLLDHPKGYLYLFVSGVLYDTVYCEAAAKTEHTFVLDPAFEGKEFYLRAEYYELEGEPPYFGYSWRNYQTVRLLSNPIYFVKGE